MHRQRQNYEMGKIQFLDDAIKTSASGFGSSPILRPISLARQKKKKKKNRFYICFSRDFTSFALEASLVNKTKSLKLYCQKKTKQNKKNEVFALSFYPRIEQDSISQLLRQWLSNYTQAVPLSKCSWERRGQRHGVPEHYTESTRDTLHLS